MSDTETIAAPGPSTVPESSLAENLYEEKEKICMEDSFLHFEYIIKEEDLVEEKYSPSIEEEALANDLLDHVSENLAGKIFVTDEELITANEDNVDDDFEEVGEPVASRDNDADDDDDYEPEKKVPRTYEYIPLSYKLKVVNMVKSNPHWNLATLQRKGCSRLKRLDYVPRWVENIKTGGTKIDKYEIVNKWTYDRFTEARANHQQVTTRSLQQWAVAAAGQFTGFNFKASKAWVGKFKRKHRIRQRKITKSVSEVEALSMDKILAVAEDFRIQARNLILKFNPDFVINTDQTECQYQYTIDKTKDMNKMIRSHTAQYSVTLSGKLIPQVFLCLQETAGNFAPKVQKVVDEYSAKYKNVIISCSRTGQLTTKLYKDFLTKLLKSYVKQENFLLLIDSWSGQTRMDMYDEIFRDEHETPTCTVKIIPPECTPLVQPSDVYLYRQINNFIKQLQNCPYLIENNREINSREDCIKIHAIVHHQLSSPIFIPMIQYAWFAAKLCDDREVFRNVNEVCFAPDIQRKSCACKEKSFIQCARCRQTFCFPCFYVAYHSGSCQTGV